jgi:maltose O-acetyltransferase
VRELATRFRLHATHRLDRLRLRVLPHLHPGLEIDPNASANLVKARFNLAPGARLRIGPRVATERRSGGVSFLLEAGAVVEIGEGTWLRSELGPVILVAFAGARMQIGPGSRVFDSDQHDLDAEHREVTGSVRIGDHTWVASDVTILRGAHIGAHCVIGSRSLVTREIPDHQLAFGIPAQPRGPVGDRTHAR